MDPGWREVGRRLKAARERAGPSQEQAADALSISRPTLSSMENGKTRIDSLLLQRASQLYRRELGYFLAENERLLAPDALEREVFARVGPLDEQDRSTVARFLTFCERWADLCKDMGEPHFAGHALPRPTIVTADTQSFVATALAKSVRNGLDVGHAPIGDRIFVLLEELGLLAYRARLKDDRVSGLLVLQQAAGPVIFVNAAQHRWRQVFTAAHELGHYLSRRNDRPVACRIFSMDDGPGAEQHLETFANQFAADLLMPAPAIQQVLLSIGGGTKKTEATHVAHLQRHFGVSFGAMLYRLVHLRLIRRAEAEQLTEIVRPIGLARDPSGAVEGEADDVADDMAQRLPGAYVEMVLDAWENDRISNGRAADMLELSRGAFDHFYRAYRAAGDASLREQGVERVLT